jgi:predicted amidophosphoribosyltransferase
MATLIQSVRRVLPRRGDLFECRRCGRDVDRWTRSCPDCGHGGIAAFDLE